MSTPVETIINAGSSPNGETLAEIGFQWREADGVLGLCCLALEKAGFANAFSTRLGGVSPFPDSDLNLAGFSEDSAENIAENRRRFLKLFDGDYRIAAVWQVHGDAIKNIDNDGDVVDSDDHADAMVSSLDGVLLGVKTADCVPVLIGDPVSGAFAAVHAGWRGTVRSIAAKAVEKLRDEYDADPSAMVAAIGPAACVGKYEVGREVIEEFAANFNGSERYFVPTRQGHARIDLHAFNRDQLIGSGLSAQNVFVAPFCTMERPDLFFSYRLEKQRYGKTGRLLSVIGRDITRP